AALGGASLLVFAVEHGRALPRHARDHGRRGRPWGPQDRGPRRRRRRARRRRPRHGRRGAPFGAPGHQRPLTPDRASRAVLRPLALLQRLLRGSGHLVRARCRRLLPGQAARGGGRVRCHTRATTGLRSHAMRDEAAPRLERRGALILLGTLGVLVALNVPELGSQAWPFHTGAVHPHGILGPLVRAAHRRWDVGVIRSVAMVAGVIVAIAALLGWRAVSWRRSA